MLENNTNEIYGGEKFDNFPKINNLKYDIGNTPVYLSSTE